MEMTAHAYALLDSYIYGFACRKRPCGLKAPKAPSTLPNR